MALTPKMLREPRAHAVVVVDVLRATSSLIAMFDQGLLRAIVSDRIQEARHLAIRNFSLLCGEVKSLPAPGFDFGNSPADFAASDFRGKSAVLFTTNGTRAIVAAADSPVAAVGSLLNRRAVAARIVEEAGRRKLDVAVVCAGAERGAAFSLEDTAAAGAIIEAARELDPALAMTDEAWAAYHLWRFYQGDAMCSFRQSAHGRALLGLGFERDLRFAARLDVSETVPLLYAEGDAKVLRAKPKRKTTAMPA